ncbi:MAG: hypothetical protein ACXVI9_00300 [Mucilaginibacter sp.]
MELLNDKKVTLISARIRQGGVIEKDLQNGLLDHYCCFIEQRMSAGQSFESAYRDAFHTITPNGMREIQEELDFILNFKQTTIMKIMIYSVGFLAAFCISTAAMLKTVHWSGARELMFGGFILLIITISLLLSNSLRHFKTYSAIYVTRVGACFVSLLLISVGGIFKLLHYPTADMQLLAGTAFFNMVFLPLFFYGLYRQSQVNATA